MLLSQLLQIPKGAVSIIGSGGKSTMLSVLARELAPGYRVILTTTTHFLPYAQWPALLQTGEGMQLLIPDEEAHTETGTASITIGADRLKAVETFHDLNHALHTAFSLSPIVITAARHGNDHRKLQRPDIPFSRLTDACDYLLIEADGSRRLPLKAHASYEPVIDPVTARIICVLGASGFGKPIAKTVHRPDIFCRLCGADMDMPVTPEMAAAVLNAEALADTVFINQLETHPDSAARFALACDFPCFGGSLQESRWELLN